MTLQDNGKEDAGGDRRKPKLSSISTKGLLASLRERGDDVASTPDPVSPRSTGSGGLFATTPRTPAALDSLSTPVPAGLDLNPLRTNINKFLTPSRTFTRLREEKEELSRLTPSPPSHSFRDGFSLPLIGEVKPKELIQSAKIWLRNPKNIALLFWGVAVAVSGAILFMVMVGMLNSVLPSRTERNTWFEVSNQIINALFTLMALYLHPQRCLHLHMLSRWRASDIVKLRNIYCKNGTRKPHEWGHMLVVVLLLQLNCIAQYALCGLNWGYRRAQRPAIGVAVCLCTSMGAAATAGIYNIVSPLGKDFEADGNDTEEMEKGEIREQEQRGFTPHTRIYRMLERRVSFAYREEGTLVQKPDWQGGVFDVTRDPPVAILTTLCSFCVFGWNMERLGFGNRFVHIITFVLICTAPFWIFDLAALNIQNYYVRHAIGGSGIALCAFGLFYGGYWRIRMRERFKLPGNRFCCRSAVATDCFQWLFLPLCSLCQEVRTAEFYDVKDDRFYSRSRLDGDSPPTGMASPHTEAPTLAAVREMSREMSASLQEMNLTDVELMRHDSPYREFNHTRSPLAPPSPVTANRNSNFPPADETTLKSSPSSKSPFLNPGTSPSNNPFLEPVHMPPNGSPGRTSSSTNPFLQAEPQHSRGSTPGRSPLRGSSSDPFTQADLTSATREAVLRSPQRASSSDNHFSPPLVTSPLRSPHRVSTSSNPFIEPEMSSTAAGENPFPVRTSSGPGNHFSPPRISSPLRSPHRVSTPNNPFNEPEMSSTAAGENPFPTRTSSGNGNPFLQPETVGSAGKHLSNPPEGAVTAKDGSGKGLF